MTRIFLTLAILSSILLMTAFGLGMNIEDVKSIDPVDQDRVSFHFLTALAGLVFATLVHAIVLTYFMGTGRWMEDTCKAYQLEETWRKENQKLKYRAVILMTLCITMLILTGAIGAAVDPASPTNFEGLLGMSGPMFHMVFAATTLTVNFLVNWYEFQVLFRNSQLIEQVMQQVRQIREERGLPV